MGRRKVVEITCDRCGRTETQNESEVSPEDRPELSLTFAEETTTWQDLCRRCRGTVENYVKRLKLIAEDKPEGDQSEQAPVKNPVGVKKGLFGTAQ